MHKMVVPNNSNASENSVVQWNVWIHWLPRENVITMSPVLVGRNFNSVDILLTFTLCQCNVMTLLNNLSGTGARLASGHPQWSRKVFWRKSSDILKKSSDISVLSIDEKFFRWSDNMFDDFEQIIRHFAILSLAMSDGPMAFCQHCILHPFYHACSAISPRTARRLLQSFYHGNTGYDYESHLQSSKLAGSPKSEASEIMLRTSETILALVRSD